MNFLKKSLLIFFLSTCCSFVFADDIHFLTYNIASLPSVFGKHINDGILQSNKERVNEIIHVIDNLNLHPSDIPAPNIIGFEEAFDPQIRTMLKNNLTKLYPFDSGDLGQKPLNAGSGLLLFSQYPFLEIHFFPYTNIMIGDELLANKGFIIAKLKYNENYFITVVLTHLEAGDAIFKKEQSKFGTVSARRGVQMGNINAEIQKSAAIPPHNYEKLHHLKTFVMGDFNAPLNNEREQKSISTGMSDNGFHKGDIKYQGQFALFSTLINTVPENFIEVRTVPESKGKKKLDPALLDKAIAEKKFTGTTFDNDFLHYNKKTSYLIQRHQTEFRIIDGLFCSRSGIPGDLKTDIVSLNEFSEYPYEMSDHLALRGTFHFSN